MAVYRTDDPIADHERYEEDRERELERCPECAYCGHPIQEAFAFHVDGEWYHEGCFRSEYYVEVIEE